MLTLILLLTFAPLAILVIGFFDIKLPFVSEHPEMHLVTIVKEYITNLFQLDQSNGQSEIVTA